MGDMHGDHCGELDPDSIDEIVKHVNHLNCTVCKKWSLDLFANPKHIKNLWLVLPFHDEYETETICPLLNLRENTIHNLELPEMRNTIFRGSYYGWLITLTVDGELQIFNPFTRAQFKLPPLATFPDVKAYEPDKLGAEYTLVNIREQDKEYTVEKSQMQTSHIWKIIISAPPDHDDQDFVAMALYGEFGRLAWCRIGDSRWTDVPSAKINCDYEDAIFHEGKIYVVDYWAQMFEFDMKTGLGGISAVSSPPNLENSKEHRKYLIGTPGGLLMVIRRLKFDGKPIVRKKKELSFSYKTSGFEIYELNTSEWLRVNSLGNNVILLGQNSSMCISCDSFPNSKGSQVYFTDDSAEFHTIRNDKGIQISFPDGSAESHFWSLTGGHDIGVFDLANGSINRLFPDTNYIWPPPVWLLQDGP